MDQSILYVDIENLQDIARETLVRCVKSWPESFPRPGTIKLYVKADLTDLWKIWANHFIPDVEVIVNGVQHYTLNGFKNSADIALALDALADFLKGKTQHIAVLSDDSDFVTLFSAIKQAAGDAGDPGEIFKWFMTSRPDTHSKILNDFLPSKFIHTVDGSIRADEPVLRLQKEEPPVLLEVKPPALPEAQPVSQVTPVTLVSTISPAAPISEETRIALSIIQNIPVGIFRSPDCKKIILQLFPEHSLAKANRNLYGAQFYEKVWPILESYGIKSEKIGREARKYEMTQEAKDKAGSDSKA